MLSVSNVRLIYWLCETELIWCETRLFSFLCAASVVFAFAIR